MGIQAPKSTIWSKTGTLTMAEGISLCALAIGV